MPIVMKFESPVQSRCGLGALISVVAELDLWHARNIISLGQMVNVLSLACVETPYADVMFVSKPEQSRTAAAIPIEMQNLRLVVSRSDFWFVGKASRMEEDLRSAPCALRLLQDRLIACTNSFPATTSDVRGLRSHAVQVMRTPDGVAEHLMVCQAKSSAHAIIQGAKVFADSGETVFSISSVPMVCPA